MSLNVKQGNQLIIVDPEKDFSVFTTTVQKVEGPTTVKGDDGKLIQVQNVEVTDGQHPYRLNELPTDRSVFTYANGTIVADSLQTVSTEARRVLNQVEQTLNSVPQLQKIQAGMTRVLEQSDRDYADKKQMREELNLLRQQNEELRRANEQQAKAQKDILAEIKTLRDELKIPKSKEK